MSTKPPVERLPAIEAALADLLQMAKDMRKHKEVSTLIGIVMDNHCALDLVRIYGSYGGKVPWPVSEPSHSVFVKHGIEDLIHPPWKPRHRKMLRPSLGPGVVPGTQITGSVKKMKNMSFNDKLDAWAKQINESVTSPLTDVTRKEVRAAFAAHKADKGEVYIGQFFRRRGKLRVYIDSDDRTALSHLITYNREKSNA